MPLNNYSLLKGSVSDIALDDDNSPHIEFRIEALNTSYRAAINVRSQIAPHDLLYLRSNNYANQSLTDAFLTFERGMTDIATHNQLAALDYVHGGFISKSDMSIAPYEAAGEHNDLKDFILPLAEEAKNNSDIDVLVIGEKWGPEAGSADKYFGFQPGNGIHDIHMNQGSRGRFAGTNGSNQDGALFFHIKSENRWVAIFLAFQSQDWNTHPQTGDPISASPSHPVEVNPLSPSITIIAALINVAGEEAGNETVSLMNRSDTTIDLAGWKIQDNSQRTLTLNGLLQPGDSLRVQLESPSGDGPRLSNAGGEIRVLADDGSIADSVSYTKQDVAREGWTSIFK